MSSYLILLDAIGHALDWGLLVKNVENGVRFYVNYCRNYHLVIVIFPFDYKDLCFGGLLV